MGKSAAAAGMMSETPAKSDASKISALRKLAKAGEEAIAKYTRLEGRTEKLKENTEEAMHEGGSLVVSMVTAGGASYAEGYYGEEKLKIFGQDGRVVGGLLSSVLGLGRTLAGKKDGRYLVAAGGGALTSKLCSSALRSGQDAAAKKAAAGNGAAPGASLTSQVQETPKAAGAPPRGEPRREIRPGRDGNVPPHVARLLRERNREQRAA